MKNTSSNIFSTKNFRKSEKAAVNIAKHMYSRKRFNRFLRLLGPGLVTGAADDDPSGIATYSQAGAQFGTSLLWVFPVMYPLLLAVQESCARIGAVTGKGLAAVIKDHYSKKLLYSAVALVVIANTVNIGADLGAMAATSQLFVGIPFVALAIFYALIIVLFELFLDYKTYAKILKWLAVALLSYPVTAFIIGQPWGHLLHETFTPHLKLDFDTIFIIVGILGTTISPYLFFWDTSETVEDEIATHRTYEKSLKSPKITKRFLRGIRLDNFLGMSLASISAWFITIVCAGVLFSHGITNIDTAADAAKALEPLVQNFPHSGLLAKMIFSVGIVGVGLLAVPVLAGSSSYAVSELLGWREGLHIKFRRAIGFYGVIVAATVAGLLINFLGINPIKALVFTAVFNGIAAVPLLLLIARIGNNKKIMGEYSNGKLTNFLVKAAFVIMAASVAVLLFAMATGKS